MTAPGGTQAGAIRNTGSASQILTVLPPGNYTIGFDAVQAANNPTFQKLTTTLQSNLPVISSTKQFVWSGNRMAEERDATNNVIRRFYPQGEQINGASYYYTRDHLGSIRELVDSTGTVQARYDYDPFGVRTKLSGSLDSEFGYTGHYYHQPRALNLALYRAYDSTLGRWISRDPVGSPEVTVSMAASSDKGGANQSRSAPTAAARRAFGTSPQSLSLRRKRSNTSQRSVWVAALSWRQSARKGTLECSTGTSSISNVRKRHRGPV